MYFFKPLSVKNVFGKTSIDFFLALFKEKMDTSTHLDSFKKVHK